VSSAAWPVGGFAALAAIDSASTIKAADIRPMQRLYDFVRLNDAAYRAATAASAT